MHSPSSFDLVVEPTDSQKEMEDGEDTSGGFVTPIISQKNVAALIYPPGEFNSASKMRSMQKLDRVNCNKQHQSLINQKVAGVAPTATVTGFEQSIQQQAAMPKIVFSSLGAATVMPIEDLNLQQATTSALNMPHFTTYCIPMRPFMAQPMQNLASERFDQIGQN